MLFLVILLILVGVVYLCMMLGNYPMSKDPGVPSGPFRLPIFGNLFQITAMDKLPHKALHKLSEKYGDIMKIQMGQVDAIVLSSYDSVKRILPHKNLRRRVLDGVIRDRNMGKNLGVNWSNDDIWVKMRTFTIRTMNEYGYGNSSIMEEIIQNEISSFSSQFLSKSKDNGGIVDMEHAFDISGTTLMWRFLTNTQLNAQDIEFQDFIRISSEFDKATNLGSSITIAFPFLRKWFPNLTNRNKVLEASGKINEFVRAHIQKHRSRADYATNPKSFVDKFLIQIGNDEENEFTEDQLIITFLDMLQGGSDTISNLLNFAILYMVRHPEVRVKVQKELDDVVGRNVRPALIHKEMLPYTRATILEILRYGIVLPIPAPREVTEDFYVKEYHFRKNTSVMINLYSVFHDKKIWDDADIFRPERFLSSDEMSLIQSEKEKIIAFGLGSRMCLAEKLGEASLFLYFSNLMQRFDISSGMEDMEMPSDEPILGMTLSPQPYKVRVKERI